MAANILLEQGRAFVEESPIAALVIAVAVLVLSFSFLGTENNPTTKRSKGAAPIRFSPKSSKGQLCPKDQLLLDVLEPELVNFVITDPDEADNPIVYSSEAFCRFTKYNKAEIEGRNCRFLQGKDTARHDVDKIRNAVTECTEANVNLLNYKKDGTSFINQFFIAPLRSISGKVIYYIGVQHEVASRAPGQHPENVGWTYTMGSHE